MGAAKVVKVNANIHPTVKSQALMKHLVRLATPKGGIVLDPFSGSGSTLVAAASEGMKFIGVEQDAEYYKIARERCKAAVIKYEEDRGSQDNAAYAMQFMSDDDY